MQQYTLYCAINRASMRGGRSVVGDREGGAMAPPGNDGAVMDATYFKSQRTAALKGAALLCLQMSAETLCNLAALLFVLSFLLMLFIFLPYISNCVES